MKLRFTISIIFLFPIFVFGQTFNLSSTSFEVGDIYRPNPQVLFKLASEEVLDFSLARHIIEI